MRSRNTEAVSPIFATLIILAVVTVLFIPVFIWSTGMVSETEDSWLLFGTMATERIVIEEVSLKANMASCTIYVRNIGKTPVSIDNVFISLSDGTGILHVYSKSGTLITFTTSPNSVIQGDLITVNFTTLDFAPASNEAYSVTVFTTWGIGNTYQVVT